jgi:hypothetical protein
MFCLLFTYQNIIYESEFLDNIQGTFYKLEQKRIYKTMGGRLIIKIVWYYIDIVSFITIVQCANISEYLGEYI